MRRFTAIADVSREIAGQVDHRCSMMRRLRRAGRVIAAMAMPSCAVVAGCSSSMNPWGYEAPPATAAAANRPMVAGQRTTIVLGELDNPKTASVRWRDIGTGTTDALVRTLRNEKRYAVRSDRRLGDSIEKSLLKSAGDRWRHLEDFRKTYPDVDYVVIGQVTDFHHNTDLPEQTRQRGWFGRKTEAIVAIQFRVVDVKTGAVVLDDHVTGTAGSTDDSSRDLYRNLAFGSYVFWNTPLGAATEQAIDRAADRIDRLVPLMKGEPMIVRVLDRRKVALNAGQNLGLAVGQQYYVCIEPDGGDFRALRDPDTNRPLTARITDVDDDHAEAWLLGRAPVDHSLRGAKLLRTQPKEPEPPPNEPAPAEDVAAGTLSTAADPPSANASADVNGARPR